MKYYLAIDIGASSGRHIVGWRENGEVRTEEVYRFPNGVVQTDGHLTWDIDRLLTEVRAGIAAAKERYGTIESLSIDTWGVDYVLLRGDEAVTPCYAYRDGRTAEAVGAVHACVPFAELYRETGIQFQPFNTVYQLYADRMAGRLEGVTDFLMIPEYLMYRLTGVKKHEYTNATTGGLVNAVQKQYAMDLIRRLGLPEHLFGRLSAPGETVGCYDGIRVVLCATHDTASAVEGIPMPEDALFLSSGTWSLLGAKMTSPRTDEASCAANFTNEGGVGYIRYLKNIMGLWIIQNLQRQLGIGFGEMVELAKTSRYEGRFDVNESRFSAPEDMRGEIRAALGEASLIDADIVNSVYHSLAYSYAQTVRELEQLTGRQWDTLYIAGGGAKNGYLNELTARYTGKKVVALPIEATALGNLKIQMEASV